MTRTASRFSRRPASVLVAILLTAALGFGLAACQGGGPLVVVYGDSIASANQSGAAIDFLLGQAGDQVIDHVFPGSSPCNWISQMQQDAQSGQMSAAVLIFTGDAFNCMDYPPGL